MSFNARMAALPGLIADKLEWPVATLKRTVLMVTDDDEAAGRQGTPTITTITGRGRFGEREATLADGTIQVEATATLVIPQAPMIGDKLTIGSRTHKVKAIKEHNPVGAPVAYKYDVTLS